MNTSHDNLLKDEQNRVVDIACVDLFCGAGGLTHGLNRQGIRVGYGVDIDPNCRFPYEENNNATFIETNVENIMPEDLSNFFGDAKLRLLAGCAPCQPFSVYSQKGRKQRNDHKWELVSVFGKLISANNPEFVTMENVPQLLHHEVFQEFLNSLTGYNVSYAIVDCAEYGIPQSRKRLVLLASRLGPISLVPPPIFDHTPRTTVRQAIAHFRPLAAGEADPEDALHAAASLSELNLRRIRASKPGGTWRDWDDELITKCHRKDTGKTYPSVYGRMIWDAPSPTITTQCFGYGNGRFGHPEQDRAISLREAAVLQTFPDAYRFVAPNEHVCFGKIGRLIGNAVPVRIGEVIAQTFLQHAAEVLCADAAPPLPA
ncbi:MAG: DNA cytosine methyltransferase [Candidatus Viridilinea halotolerans]|uniref:DNA (cytosine-5-)-methyltransferase n=1 Tax=Candidatus Viridilinea halotolerans TaxID=2491704 RepID=A0A426TVT0_9CHLR|nr:MAG: DNA cytosine methyltransferase [Candidatus Viridilinea halotolerans]